MHVKIRSAFETTPLFRPRIAVGTSGRTSIRWTLPDNTGAYELRAYAVSLAESLGPGGALGGGATATQLVRKRVTLQASVPRIARVGDAFRCGVTATGSPELPAGSTIVATLALRPLGPPPHPVHPCETVSASGCCDAMVASPMPHQCPHQHTP